MHAASSASANVLQSLLVAFTVANRTLERQGEVVSRLKAGILTAPEGPCTRCQAVSAGTTFASVAIFNAQPTPQQGELLMCWRQFLKLLSFSFGFWAAI